MSINANITEKKYKKLALQVTLNGFSYCVFDTLHHKITTVKTVDFSTFAKTNSVEDYYAKAFLDDQELNAIYDDVVIIHDNNLNTFVPKALFDQDYLGSYLQYNTKVFETDFFTHDALLNYEMNNVYIPYININNYLIDQFGHFDYRHAASILVEKLLDLSKNKDEKKVFVHLNATKFEIIVVQNQQLLFFNTFEYQTKEDFIYYILFTAEQLNLNPENFHLQLMGEISEDSALYEMAFQYVRNVSLLDISNLQNQNSFSTVQNLKHFILFQS